jgi:Family of unknown function (DUF5706)
MATSVDRAIANQHWLELHLDQSTLFNSLVQREVVEIAMTTDQAQAKSELPNSFPRSVPQNIGSQTDDLPHQEPSLRQSQFETGQKETHWKFANETHKYVREFIYNADNKAQHYILFASAFLAWMNSSESLKFWSVPAKEWRLMDLINIFSIVGMTLCILFALIVLLPRLKGSKKGIVFFDSISEHDVANDYLADVLKKNEQELVLEELRHVFELARVCSRKFLFLKLSVWAGTVGLILGLLLILFR